MSSKTDTWKALTEPVDKTCDNCAHGFLDDIHNHDTFVEHCAECDEGGMLDDLIYKEQNWKWDKK